MPILEIYSYRRTNHLPSYLNYMRNILIAPGLYLIRHKKWRGYPLVLFHVILLLCAIHFMFHFEWVPNHYWWANVVSNFTYAAEWNGIYYFVVGLLISGGIRYWLIVQTKLDNVDTWLTRPSVLLSLFYFLLLVWLFLTGHNYSSSLLHIKATQFSIDHYQATINQYWGEEVVFDYKWGRRDFQQKEISLELLVYAKDSLATPSHQRASRKNGRLFVTLQFWLLDFVSESVVLFIDGQAPITILGDDPHSLIVEFTQYNQEEYQREFALWALYSNENFWEYIRPFFGQGYSLQHHRHKPLEEIYQCGANTCDMVFQIIKHNPNLVQENFVHAGEVKASFNVVHWYFVPTSIVVEFEGEEVVVVK